MKSQELELIHLINSDHFFNTKTEDNRDLLIYLHFDHPGTWDYKSSPIFFINGWYQVENDKKKDLVGIYRPHNSLTAFVLEGVNHISQIENSNKLNVDTTKYLERFFFPSLNDLNRSYQANWFDGYQTLIIDNIYFDKKNINHRVDLSWNNIYSSQNSTINITNLVTFPFGDNNLFLEDFNINVYQQCKDTIGNWHVLLFISNEYVVPSSASSRGFYYILIDKYQVIRETNYLETYNQGKYTSYIDTNYNHKTKQRHLIIDDWSSGEIVGSFFINYAKIEVEINWW